MVGVVVGVGVYMVAAVLFYILPYLMMQRRQSTYLDRTQEQPSCPTQQQSSEGRERACQEGQKELKRSWRRSCRAMVGLSAAWLVMRLGSRRPFDSMLTRASNIDSTLTRRT